MEISNSPREKSTHDVYAFIIIIIYYFYDDILRS